MPRQLNTEPVNLLPADHPAFRIQLPSHVEPMPPTVPFYRADGSRVDPIEAAWQPPEPPKDWRTRMREALSDKNIRYYAGPGFSQFLENLAGLVPILPGSGTVESQQDGREAANEFEAGNYGKAATHLGVGTLKAGLDWMPPAKLLAVLGGGFATMFPRKMLPKAFEMEAAGKSADEIWQATRLGRSVDGRWVFEIPDKGYRVYPNAGELKFPPDRVANLYDHLAHLGMRLNYPDFASMKSYLAMRPGVSGAMQDGVVLRGHDYHSIKSTGIHELQHLIDMLEGGPRSYGQQYYRRLGMSPEEAFDHYERQAAEVAARNAQYRMTLSERERRLRSPQSTEKIPRDQQIETRGLREAE
jgi:hypothetical protein